MEAKLNLDPGKQPPQGFGDLKAADQQRVRAHFEEGAAAGKEAPAPKRGRGKVCWFVGLQARAGLAKSPGQPPLLPVACACCKSFCNQRGQI